MKLQDIAQKIVDATMEIIDNRNVNIMDKNGFIIASGDRNRITTFHKGADDVIKSNKDVEIYPEDVKNYPGAKEGVNMPINIEGKVLGVVGVYGHPDKVRIVANLVKTSVELAFEQYLISEQVKLVGDLKQQIIRKIIYQDVTKNEEEILCLCKVASLEISTKRVSVIIELIGKDKMDSGEVFKNNRIIEKYMMNSRFIDNNDIIGIINDNIVVFKSLCYYKDEITKEYLEKLSRKIYENCGLEIRIACGSFYEGIHGLKESYNESKSLFNNSNESVQDIKNLNVQTTYLLNQIENEKLEHFIKPIYEKVLNDKGIPEVWIINTLEALFENDLNLSETAKCLYLHKNSLVYRVKKIEKLLGLSVTTNFNHSVLLKLLLVYIHKVNNKK
ncbi:sugar diacid recognition domain-containing protein [Clostridium sediminicola]|uniref:CdaR family transcriptional regulator n=1 Tax=Clostridium sediminicola TaxID=3114879 RepID=UPI0031F1E762